MPQVSLTNKKYTNPALEFVYSNLSHMCVHIHVNIFLGSATSTLAGRYAWFMLEDTRLRMAEDLRAGSVLIRINQDWSKNLLQ